MNGETTKTLSISQRIEALRAPDLTLLVERAGTNLELEMSLRASGI